METRSNASLVRNGLSSPTASWRTYQQPNYDSQAVQRGGQGRHIENSGDPRLPIVDEVINLPVQTPVEEVEFSFQPS